MWLQVTVLSSASLGLRRDSTDFNCMPLSTRAVIVAAGFRARGCRALGTTMTCLSSMSRLKPSMTQALNLFRVAGITCRV